MQRTLSGRTMHAFWNQVPNKGSATGTAVASWPANGHGWKVTAVKPPQTTSWDFGLAAATGGDGQPWVAFVDSANVGFEVWHQRTTATGLGHHLPGVYLSYLTGWPTAQRVKLIKLGAKTPTTIATLTGVSGSTLAADPFGRLWVAWYISSPNPTIWLRRAGSGAGKFGRTVKLSLPKGTSTLWKVYLNAQAKRVDVLALASVGSRTGYFATQVLPPR